jgi:phenylalanyl-tRNA synthetase beta subunit
MVKQLDYQVVRSSLIPRMLSILEKAANIQVKQKTLEILNEIIGGIDPHTMKDKIMKTFEKIRTTESDP